ncbi:putative cell wall protein PGA61 [Candida viswanathii]|uniref:Putative cell wall protein PGA61 n=1 Tax=Candida viswanathii TaxID=5486 RepID=A0A367YGP0_9ASCO|nr:putative cell wall protein PGA61 [Candida viswanathii]
MRIEVLLAILPAVLAAETASSDAAPAGASCNLHCSMVVEAQSKFCPNDSTGSCLCSLSVDDFWKHYAECNCTNPEGLDAESAKSQECATVQGGSDAAAATSAPEASSPAAAEESATATDAPAEANAPAEASTDAEAAPEASAPAEASAPVEAAPSDAGATLSDTAASGAASGDCNMHCKEVDAIEKQFCAEGDINCLCQLSDEQYWEHVHDCNCINDKSLPIDQIKAQVCNATAPASTDAAAAAPAGTDAAAGTDAPTLATAPQVSAYGGDSNSTGFVPQVALQSENKGSKKVAFSLGALAVAMVNFL